jgi:hypothetical protein
MVAGVAGCPSCEEGFIGDEGVVVLDTVSVITVVVLVQVLVLDSENSANQLLISKDQ